MHTVTPRAGRRPLALSLAALTALTALTALGACADEPAAPKPPSTLAPKASVLAGGFVEVTVTNASGGTDVGSLRWAADQITSAGGAISFAATLEGGTIILNAPLAPDGPMYIVGPQKGITISGNDQHRVIDAHIGARVSLENVTVTNGYAADYGSAISAPSVYLQNSTVRDSRGPGSAIRVRYVFDATNSTVSRNTVGSPAVEYYGEDAQVFVRNSTIAYNAPGPGIGPYGTVGPSLRVFLNNSIISNNGTPLKNCLTSYGFEYEGRIISNDWSCKEGGNTVVADPLLLPLADNGGPSMTHAIPHLSPAFNAGVNCTVATDQRYVPRDAKCDVGAFEFTDFTTVTIAIDPNVKVDAATGRALLTGTVACTRDDAFRLALELHQDQKVGKQVVDIHAATDIPVGCTTSPTPWGATMGLAPGETFQAGAARATAQTYSAPEWVTPAAAASAVRISIVRK